MASKDITSDLDSSTSSAGLDSSTAEDSPGFAYSIWIVVIFLIIFIIIIVGTILGNILVCTAVSIVRKLRTPSNWLIVSLAVADLSVAIVVMPFAAMYEIRGSWVLGEALCTIYTSLDVLLCTSSILNLCMISIDRYFVITKPFQYALKRTPARMALMIFSVWSLSAIISIPPAFGWKQPYKHGECMISTDIGYQLYATIGAFYLPLTVMIVIYYRIYVVSSRIAKAESKNTASKKPSNASDKDTSGHSLFGRRKSSLSGAAGAPPAPGRGSMVAEPQYGRSGGPGGGPPVTDNGTKRGSAGSRQNSDDGHSTVPLTSNRKSIGFLHRGGSGGLPRVPGSSKSERKATKTLGVIMGAFTFCWLPFFILALINSMLSHFGVILPAWVGVLTSALQWLGYTNSFLNPIIYARFNRDFRTPFKEILLCRCRGINVRLRSESYIDQYGPSNESNRRSSLARPSSGTGHVGLGTPAVGEHDGLLKAPLPSQPDIIVEGDGIESKPEENEGKPASPHVGTKVTFE